MIDPEAIASVDVAAAMERLQAQIRPIHRAAVAFSAGVDSTLLFAVVYRLLGENAVALTAVSPSLPRADREESIALASRIGGRHVLVDSHEMEDPRYAENTDLRCYFCKTEVYGLLAAWAAEHGYEALFDGTNFDDLHDVRPGRKAAREHGVKSPLLEAGLGKLEVRALARSLELPNWDKPAMACLSSRVPHGTAVTAPLLARIEQAEEWVRRLGIAQVRVRHHGEVARVEVEKPDIPRLFAQSDALAARLRELGWTHTQIDPDGYRTGSLNRPEDGAGLHGPVSAEGDGASRRASQSLVRSTGTIRVGRVGSTSRPAAGDGKA